MVFFDGRNLNSDKIMFGTDGMHSDIIQSAKSAFLSGFNNECLSQTGTYKRLRNIHNYLTINKFIGDSQNNLIVLDYIPPTELNNDNFLSHFLYGINSKHITHVISSGKIIVENRIVTTLDQEKEFEEARKQSLVLWKAIKNNFN